MTENAAAAPSSGGFRACAPPARTSGRGCAQTSSPGVVLAAILVPQGMAYAELAGLPAVTGLYTTIACLIGYALFGPSRVLVLGPDSSISPLIFAAITPLLVAGGDPGNGHRARGDAGDPRRARRDRARDREARLRRGPALEGGAGRVHERPGDRDHRRAAAEALRVLDRRRRLPRRDQGVRRGPRPDQHHDPRRRRRRAARAADPAPADQGRARRAGRRRRRHGTLGRTRPLGGRRRHGRRAATGRSQPEPSVDGCRATSCRC